MDHYLITVGETVEIVLESNWSTGYRWYFLNEDELSSVSNTDFDYGVEKAEEDPEEICGVPGFETWTFTGASRGTEILIFEYKNAFEDKATDRKKKVKITVE